MISSDALNPDRGTLVVWSEPDRIIAQPQTIFDQLEEQIGRIYRRYIDEGELTIRMASFRPGEQNPRIDRVVRPNDPLYVMRVLQHRRRGIRSPCSGHTRQRNSL